MKNHNALNQYLVDSFQNDLYNISYNDPNEIIKEFSYDFGIDKDTVFFGKKDWANYTTDIAVVLPENRPYFILALFGITMIDYTFDKYFKDAYSLYRKETAYPKFGWSGYTVYLECPSKLITVPENNTEIPVTFDDEVIQVFTTYLYVFAGKYVSKYLEQVSINEFFSLMINDETLKHAASSATINKFIADLKVLIE